jgi:Xaa-Pro aminopeptidase
MERTFTSDFFTSNRERLRQLFTGTAPIVITAHGQLQKAVDEAFPFHQDRSFFYLTGLNVPDLILVMDKGKEYLIVPVREASTEKFDGVINPEELSRISGIQTVMLAKEGWKQLESRLKKVQHVATLAAAPAYIDHFGLYTNPARAALQQRLKEINANLELLDLRTHLARMRMVKQPVEIEAIQGAIDVTIDTIKHITRPKNFLKYEYEYEIEADLSYGFRHSGAQGHAFSPIVASGERSCTMHHIDNNAALVSGEPLVLDVGAQSNHYAADITRTYAVGNNPSRRLQQVHAAVMEVQDYAFSLLKPGVIIREYEQHIEAFMGEKLRELGLIKSIDHNNVRHYFPHATSHFLGLDTHDGGDYEHPLEPGVVLTVEPGIYIPEEAIGVRIEDDVLITEDGIKNLSERLPRDLV